MIKIWVGIRVGLRCTKEWKTIGVLLVLVGVDSHKDGQTNVCVCVCVEKKNNTFLSFCLLAF